MSGRRGADLFRLNDLGFPEHPTVKLLFWCLTTLLIGFSAGVIICDMTGFPYLACVAGF